MRCVVRFNGSLTEIRSPNSYVNVVLLYQRVFDREGLALSVDRDRRDLVQRVCDRREIALGVIAKGCRVAQRIGHGGRWYKVKHCPSCINF
jgi:hypothetical protein